MSVDPDFVEDRAEPGIVTEASQEPRETDLEGVEDRAEPDVVSEAEQESRETDLTGVEDRVEPGINSEAQTPAEAAGVEPPDEVIEEVPEEQENRTP